MKEIENVLKSKVNIQKELANTTSDWAKNGSIPFNIRNYTRMPAITTPNLI